jgi:hypothetical protein
VELASCKDDEEGVGWLGIKAIAMTARNDKRRKVRSQLLYVRTGTGTDGNLNGHPWHLNGQPLEAEKAF